MNLRRFGSVLFLTMALAPAALSAAAAPANYAGLVYSGSPNAGAQSGRFVLFVSSNQKFSGRMAIGDRDGGFSGRFDSNGAADVVVRITTDSGCDSCDPPIPPTKRAFWDVHFQLTPTADSLTGTVHFRRGGFPDGTLSGKRSSFNSTNQTPAAGNFTFVLAGTGDPTNTNFPTGNSFGTIFIDSFGDVGLSVSSADTWVSSQSTLLCDDGTFPMFVALYHGNGMIQGWVSLTNTPAADLAGDVVWAKPSFAWPTFYPAGFTNEVPFIGSRYTRTSPMLNWTNGVVIFQGGKLSSPFTNAIALNTHGAVVNLSNNRLTLKLRSVSGRFDGSANEPSTGDRISFQGVVLQKEGAGFGFFPDAPLSGQVSLGPAD